MSFKKDGYTIAKKAISLPMANVCFGYLITKKNVFDFLKKRQYLITDEIQDYFGHEGDSMLTNTYSIYGSALYDTLLIELAISNTSPAGFIFLFVKVLIVLLYIF